MRDNRLIMKQIIKDLRKDAAALRKKYSDLLAQADAVADMLDQEADFVSRHIEDSDYYIEHMAKAYETHVPETIEKARRQLTEN